MAPGGESHREEKEGGLSQIGEVRGLEYREIKTFSRGKTLIWKGKGRKEGMLTEMER